jgi:thiamine-monophosphate kinase
VEEFSMLRHVFAANDALGPRVVVPPGDDMAQIRLDGRDLLVAVDQIVGGRHFDPAVTPLELVGRKAITRSLSDIAAMAGRPAGTLVAVTLPADFGEDRACRLFDAMRTTAAAYDCPLVGGDIAVHGAADHPLVCSVTVLAEPTTARPVTRGGVRPGDAIYVTGALGGSRGSDELGRHLTFEPRLGEAIELARILGDRLHAMIDVSDGLGRDAGHLAEQSDVGIELDADRLPRAAGVDDWRRAMGDGEDYELCFTATGAVPESVLDLPVTCVGRAVAAPAEERTGRVVVLAGDGRHDASRLGWEHEG